MNAITLETLFLKTSIYTLGKHVIPPRLLTDGTVVMLLQNYKVDMKCI